MEDTGMNSLPLPC